MSNYPNPISLLRGDNVKIGREDSKYVGWLFCTNTKTNRSGWCPKQIIEPTKGDRGVCLEDYSANELNVETTQKLIVLKELNNLVWYFDGLLYGWVPLVNLGTYV